MLQANNCATDAEGASATIARAERRLAAGDFRGAHADCLELVRAGNDAGEALALLAVIAAAHDNHRKAIDLFERAVALGARRPRARAHQARSLIALNEREAAIAAAREAIAAGPSDALTWDTLGVVFSRAGLHEEAVALYERAVALRPSAASYQYNHAATLQFLNRMPEARAAYRRCLAIDPRHVRAWSGLAQIETQTEADLVALADLFGALDEADADGRLHVGHALAKGCEDVGRVEEAMDWLARAKARKREALGYDRAADARLFDAAVATLRAPARDGYGGAAPIFVVGMPRTGTTLVERIVSAHSEVTSAGELTDFSLVLKRMTTAATPHVLDPETLRAALAVDPAQVGEAYVRRVKDTLGPRGRFVDKMPLNAFYAPLILRALPNARVICVRRGAADTILSNYRQLFATSFSYYNYAYDLEDAAHYVVGFTRMASAFADALSAERYMEVRYEDVVHDLEGQTRRLLDFCGLDFEPDCLDFHRNAAPVATASSAQVRRPLYATSVGRWRRCADRLGPALKILGAAGIAPD